MQPDPISPLDGSVDLPNDCLFLEFDRLVLSYFSLVQLVHISPVISGWTDLGLFIKYLQLLSASKQVLLISSERGQQLNTLKILKHTVESERHSSAL